MSAIDTMLWFAEVRLRLARRPFFLLLSPTHGGFSHIKTWKSLTWRSSIFKFRKPHTRWSFPPNPFSCNFYVMNEMTIFNAHVHIHVHVYERKWHRLNYSHKHSPIFHKSKHNELTWNFHYSCKFSIHKGIKKKDLYL